MRIDLLAGTVYAPAAMTAPRPPVILVFDSGLGGLTVFADVMRARPDAALVYAADDAAFPYGRLDEAALVARVALVMERLIASHRPDLVVVACNTASTLVLPALRRRFAIPFVGTVPAIRPAAQASRTRRFSVLATPGTVARDYTRDLVAAYAADCVVDLVGSVHLAALAERELAGNPAPDAALMAELAPCFVEGPPRTDAVVLACTHYPLLLTRFVRLAPWPVAWIDPAPAIARRVVALLGGPPPGRPVADGHLAIFTGRDPVPPLRGALARIGIAATRVDPLPLALN